jgi:hypothetical protein
MDYKTNDNLPFLDAIMTQLKNYTISLAPDVIPLLPNSFRRARKVISCKV